MLVALLVGLTWWGAGPARAASDKQPVTRTDTDSPAYRQFVFAYRLLGQGEDELAGEAFDEFIETYPSDPWHHDGLFYRALIARRMDQIEESERLISQVRSTSVAPGYAVRMLRGQLHLDSERYGQAVRVLKQIQPPALSPASGAALSYLRAVARHGVRDLGTAAKHYKQAAKTASPIQGLALLELAGVQDALGKSSAALSTLARCLKLNDQGTTVNALLMGGRISYRQQWLDKAVQFYKSALDKKPDPDQQGDAVIGLMTCLFDSGKHRPAITTFRRYRGTLAPSDLVRASYLAAVVRQALGEDDQAIGLLQRILPKAFDVGIHDKVLLRLALSWFRKGEYGRSLDGLEDFARLHPKSPLRPHAQFLHATANIEVGELETAVAQLTPIINSTGRHPYYAQALLQRARVYDRQADIESAGRDYRAYLDSQGFNRLGRQGHGQGDHPVTPQARQAFLRLLEIHHRLGRFAQVTGLAGRWLEHADLDPLTTQQALYRRALGLIKQGHRPDALEALQRLLTDYPQNRFRAQGLYRRGLLHLTLGDTDKGLADLVAAVDTDSATPLGQDTACKALGLIADYRRRTGDDERSTRAMMKLREIGGIERIPGQDRLWLAGRFISQGDARAGLDWLGVLVDPTLNDDPLLRAEALLLTGKGLARLAQYSKASDAIRQAMTTDPAVRTTALLELGAVLAGAGKLDEALHEFAPLTESSDARVSAQALFASGEIHKQLAMDHRSAGRGEQAEQAAHQAILRFKRLTLMLDTRAASPLHELGYIELAEVHTGAGDTERAISELRRLEQDSTDSTYTRFASAMIAALEDRAGDALFLLHELREQELDPRLRVKVDRLMERWQLGNEVDRGGP